jgi:ubiquinone/menaquinone biosynthesis C-methylase UbiE
MTKWEQFFNGHAPLYMGNAFTKNTVAEVDFLVEELALRAGSSILDMGCGTGRHSVELAKRGYAVTGVDLSAGMLAEARKAAEAAGVAVEWVQCDATRFMAAQPFEAAVCLCEGAFGLINDPDEADTHDLAILRNIHAVLKPGAKFILTALNGFAAIRKFTQEEAANGRFDPLRLIETFPMEWETPEGKRAVTVCERRYLPQELRQMFTAAGFTVEAIWGGTAGKWGRRMLELDEVEMMVVGRNH